MMDTSSHFQSSNKVREESEGDLSPNGPQKGKSKQTYSKYDSVLSLYSLKDLSEYMEDNYHKGSSNVPSSSGSLVDWNFKRQVWIRKAEKRPQKDFLPHAHLLRVECGGDGQSNKGGADSIQRV